MPLRRRATSFALAIAAHLLVFLLVWGLVPPERFVAIDPRDSFTLLPDRAAGPDPARSPQRAAARAQARAAPKRAATTLPPRDAPPPPPPPPVVAPDPMLRLFGQKGLFDGADVARLGRDRGEVADSGASAGDSKAAYGPGEGPGGRRLFNAEWQTEPSSSQLAPYIRPDAPRPGWGMVACRTVDDYRVDDCRQLGESPLGSGYAAAVRQAAWQFRVRPPRINGKAQVGAWVRIRIDYTVSGIR